MKKFYCFLSLALLATTPVLTSCGDDDDDDKKVDYKDLTLVTDFDADFESDFMQLCDVTVTVNDFNGNSRDVTLTNPDWESKLTTSTFPASVSYRVKITKKPNVTLNKSYYDLECDLSFEADSYIGSRKTVVVHDTEMTLSSAERVAAADVDAELDRIISMANTTLFAYSFTADPATNTVSYTRL